MEALLRPVLAPLQGVGPFFAGHPGLKPGANLWQPSGLARRSGYCEQMV